MAKKIRCPNCGNNGDMTWDQEAFEIRGNYQGKAIRKCKKCGVGLEVGVLSGARIIPAGMWREMEAIWEREFGSR